MTTGEWILFSLVMGGGILHGVVLLVLIRVLDHLQQLHHDLTVPQPVEHLHALEAQERLDFAQPVTILDVLLGRHPNTFDPLHTGSFKGRQPWR